MEQPTDKPPRKKTMEIHIPLQRREDRAGGEYYVAASTDIDHNVNLGDFVVLVLLGSTVEGSTNSHPQLVFRPRDFVTEDAKQRR